MGLDLTGIRNVEFYSGHYLDAVLEGDLKGVFERWRKAEEEDGRRAPEKELASLATKFFAARDRAEGERDPEERWHAARDFHAHLLPALGYAYQPEVVPLDDAEVLPVLLALKREGRPFLWIVDAPFVARQAGEEDDDPMDVKPLRAQLPPGTNDEKIPEVNWRELFDDRLFRLDPAPRWILFLAGNEITLIERSKWPQGKSLSFDLGELFGRKDAKTLRATAALLHKDVLAPDEGLCLHDALDENSHKHAFAVSGNLKHGVRRAVELLANEAVWYRREFQKQGVFQDEAFASKLTPEALTWMYRLLFLFYVEARGAELGIVPMKSEAYRSGYSLESLRDLELVPLTTEQARNGYFLHDSVRMLFRIVNTGFPERKGGDVLDFGDTYHDTMRLDPLNSPLFDDDRFEVLKNVRFRNFVLQEILQLLSLSGEVRGHSRGRISYASLGINQLGSVYEGILSYTGFFASEDMYEVASADECAQLSGKTAAAREALKTYFVPASRIADYEEAEIVKEENGRKVVHKKGAFIFRLAGRNREKSASYYTPEVLTRCLVKYALKELLWDEGKEGAKPTRKKSANEILALTICEPAMGSSAFLIEAVDQLADAYLEAKQEERGETIPPEAYQREKRRVKARLATNNCYGVDLNPTAVELAKVSLWLATLYEDGKCPWFGLRLATGNSLVGARREVFKTADVTRKGTKDAPNWLGLVPKPVPLHHGKGAPPRDAVDWANWTAPPRPKGTIYHFLLPAEGMAAFDNDKVIKELAPGSVRRINEWRKEFCKPFNKKDAERLEQISDAVDRLFAQVVRERVLATQETSDRIPVWGEPPSAKQADLLVRDQEEVAASLEDGSSAYRRLKLAMDAWCALWFWPIEGGGLLPDRATWLAQMELVLKGQVTHEEVWQQQGLFANLTTAASGQPATALIVAGDLKRPHETSSERLKRLEALSNAFRDRRANYFDECGLADVGTAREEDASLGAVQEIADRLRFHHWPLRFAEVFATCGGFDLLVGNPPWIKLRWDEGGLLSDNQPMLAIRSLRATDFARLRGHVLQNRLARDAYLAEFSELEGSQNYQNEAHNYSLLGGIQTNSYKCFVCRAWQIGSPTGITGFLHPEGVYDDPNGGLLREHIYPRLRSHFQLINELGLFPEVAHIAKFSINIYSSAESEVVAVRHMSNLFHPSTIDSSASHDGHGPVPGIKDPEDSWEVRGHRRRVVRVDGERLGVFSALFDEPGTPALRAQLPIVHSEEIVQVLEKIGAPGRKLGELSELYFTTEMWHETNAQKDGTIKRETRYPVSIDEWIVSGPHIYVATPLNKTPNEGCRSHGDYTALDLPEVAADYLPRTNYVPACDGAEYRSRTPQWRGRPVTGYFRHIHKALANPVIERTLVSALIPPGPGHVNVLSSIASEDVELLALLAGFTASLPFDFLAKSSGKSGLYQSFLQRLPFPESSDVKQYILRRSLMLNSVTQHYSSFWLEGLSLCSKSDSSTSRDPRMVRYPDLGSEWSHECVLRTDLERRQALLECDVLCGFALSLELEQLLTIYRVQFPVLQQYERDRHYDQNGRIVPTSKTASGNPAASLVELAVTLKEQAGFDVRAEYHPHGSNTQELRTQKIRLGKKEADVLGVSERCAMADLLAETEVRWSDEDHPEGRSVRLVGLRYNDPGLEPRMERVYPTPWTRCDREADYRQAWAEFERRLGKQRAKGGA